MAETTDFDELASHAKRKPDPTCEEKNDLYPQKAQKLEAFDTNSLPAVENSEEQVDNPKAENLDKSSSRAGENDAELGSAFDVNDDDDEEDYEDEDDDDEYEDEDGAKSNGNALVDPKGKGKGIMKDVKGKGKLVEEDEDDEDEDSDDDSSGGGSELDGEDSDLSDDPLAEVDLDNILPSRTRRRTAQRGVYIANDLKDHRHDDRNV